MEARRRVREHAIALSAPQAGLTFSAGGDEVRAHMMCERGVSVHMLITDTGVPMSSQEYGDVWVNQLEPDPDSPSDVSLTGTVLCCQCA